MQISQSYLTIIFIFIYCCIAKQGMTLSGDIGAHDPSTIIKEGDKYWVFTTGDGINAKYSTDLYNWTEGSKLIFARGTWPPWINSYVPNFGGMFWAPDVIFMNDRYYLYYACSTLGSPVSAIGLATSPTLDQNSPNYGWKDLGMVVSSLTNENINAIDPSVFKDSDGRLYLTYGSYSDGIGVIELDAATGKVKPGAALNRVAGGNNTPWEASYLLKEGNYYYLFANRAYCCMGAFSTYYIVAGRSESPTGPFADKNGINLRDNAALAGGTPVMVSSGRYIGPGHFALLRDNGRNVVSMHYYDGYDNGNPKLDISTLQFTDDGWPVINRNYLTAGRYKVTDRQGDLSWQAPVCSDANHIILNTDNNSSCQQWDITPVGDGYYKIGNAEKNEVIDVPSCNASNGINLQGWSWLNNDCQKYKVDQLANGQYVFTSLAARNGSRVIRVSDGASAGTALSLFDYKGTATQQWSVSQLKPPTVINATNITDTGFTINWSSLPNATYRLDVMSTLADAAFATVAAWDFESGTNKSGAGIPENIGKSIIAVGINNAIYNSKGNGGQTAQATGWQKNNREKYWEINFTTAGYYNLKVSSKQRSASTGPRHFKLQFKIGEGGTYSDIPIGIVSNLDNYTAGVLNNITLPRECENQPSVYLRWLLITSTSLKDEGIESTAASNIDDIVIKGNRGNFLPGYENLLVEDTTKVVEGLPSGTDFFCRVRDQLGGFTSVNSDLSKVTTSGSTALNFKSIEAEKQDKDVRITWQLSPEKNVAGYEVERSGDGHLFTQIAGTPTSTLANAQETHSYIDEHPLLANNFYRVKAITLSGVVKYSATVKVYIEKGKSGTFFYPNPFDGKTINIHFFDDAAGINQIQLFNSAGQEVYRTEINHAGGSLNLTLLLGNLPSGIYHSRVTNGNTTIAQTIVVGNR